MSKKRYVIDTCVLLNDSKSIFKFEDNEVIIPTTVVEEYDRFKKDSNENGRNARQISRYIDAFMISGDIIKGVALNDKGGLLRVDPRYEIKFENVPKDINLPLDYSVNDNRIINCAYINDATIISSDTNLRIIAMSYGIPAEDYNHDKVDTDDLYTGFGDITVTSADINKLYEDKYIQMELGLKPMPNQCYTLRSDSNEKHSALVCYNEPMREFRLIDNDLKTMGIQPRNTEQQFALHLLRDPNIKLVTLSGKAGSGKGLLSTAAALRDILEEKKYEKLVIARPIVSLNNKHQLGFMKGDMDEKLAQWLKPFYENINFILSQYDKVVKPPKKQGKKKKDVKAYEDEMEKAPGVMSFFDELKAWDLMELASLESIKGRTFMNQCVIITEAQDCTLADIKAIVTRIGEGSKLILEGDFYQVDNPYLDSSNNGLTHVAEKFRPYSIAGHITLQKSERSELAELAANIL